MKLFYSLIALMLVTGSMFSQERSKLVAVNVEKSQNAVIITWMPSIQPEVNYFEVQRSHDGASWKVVGLVFPFEDSTAVHTYTFKDKTATGTAHYRIRQIDMNKNEKFSEIKMVSNLVAEK